MYKLRMLIGLVVFVSMTILIWRGSTKEYNKWDLLLNNNIIVQGKVSNIKNSHNHDFGIILVQLDSANLKDFNGHTTGDVIYPYKIKNGKAELYVDIPYELVIGDRIIMNSNERGGRGYDNDTLSRKKGVSVQMLSDYNELNYIRNNTDLK